MASSPLKLYKLEGDNLVEMSEDKSSCLLVSGLLKEVTKAGDAYVHVFQSAGNKGLLNG